MPERSLLIFPHPESVDRPAGRGFGSKVTPPTDEKGQAKRIEEQFARVQSAFVSDEPGEVDRVLVMETSSRIDGLQNAVRNIEGLEWLAEVDVDDIELHELYDEETRKKIQGGRFYILSSNKQATDRLLGLWHQYRAEKGLPHGFGKFKEVFTYLLTLRRWGLRDRLRDTGILDAWAQEYQAKRGFNSEITFEVELHFWKGKDKRSSSLQEVASMIESVGGNVGQSTCIDEIGFHALKASLPVTSISSIIDHDWEIGEPSSEIPPIFQSESVRYFRPIGQNIDSEGELQELLKDMEPVEAEGPPALALLDGAPFERHKLLQERIRYSDPDSFLDDYEPSLQKHGTAMASLICHGDLSRRTGEIKSLKRKIYARPIMKPNRNRSDNSEEIPAETFQEDITEKAVREMFEGDPPSAPTVRVINFSLGNSDQHYLHEMSPWARLLDWLSFKYNVLFIVSAGNYLGSIRLIEPGDMHQPSFWNNRQATLRGIDENQRTHRLLSPAESLNSLTVGALQGDSSGDLNPSIRASDPINDMGLPSPYSRIGPGYRGAIKPDIYVQGGRLLYDQDPNDDKLLQPIKDSLQPPGIQVASPSVRPEILSNTSYHAGTSHAAAITTHYAGHVFEMLEDLRREYANEPSSDFDAVLIKTLFVHGTSRGQNPTAYEHLKNSTNSRKFKRYVSRYLGFGNSQFERVLECTRTRVTAIGYGILEDKHRHHFVYPLPVKASIYDHLRLTVTLAWFSPINPFHLGLRRARLFFEMPGLKANEGYVRQECDWQQVRKGTVQHEIFELNKINLLGTELELFVECAADAGTLDDEIPYGIAVTLEVAEQEKIDLYEMVKERIRPRARVARDSDVSGESDFH